MKNLADMCPTMIKLHELLKKAVLVFFANPGHGLISSAIKKKNILLIPYIQSRWQTSFFSMTHDLPLALKKLGFKREQDDDCHNTLKGI